MDDDDDGLVVQVVDEAPLPYETSPEGEEDDVPQATVSSIATAPVQYDRLSESVESLKQRSKAFLNSVIPGRTTKDLYEELLREGVEPVVLHKSVGFALVLSAFWATVVWLGAVYGLATDGWTMYSRYFTNWMWTSGAVFYTIYVLGFLDASGLVHDRLIYIAFWPYFANVMAVLFLAPIMLLEDSSMLTEAAEQYSWGVVHLVEWAKHSLPAVVIFIWIVLLRSNIESVMARLRYSTQNDRELFWMYMIVEFIICNSLPVGYSVNNNFHHVYHMRLNTWVAIAIIELIFVLFLVVPILLTTPISDPYSHHPLVPLKDVLPPQTLRRKVGAAKMM